MDIKSIVRVFKFNELSRQAEQDPTAKRPPTIKFLGVALLIGALAVGFGYLVMMAEDTPTTSSAGGALTVPRETGNTTTPAPTTSPGDSGSHPASEPLIRRVE